MENISLEWLEKHNAVIELTGTLQEKMVMVGIIYHMLPQRGETEKKDQVISLFSGLTPRTFQRYKKSHFELTTSAEIKKIQKQMKGAPSNPKDSFSIRLLDRNSKKPIGQVFCNFAKLYLDTDSTQFKEKKVGPNTQNLTEEEIELIAIKICEQHSIGKVTIEECCESEGIDYMTFVGWALKYPLIKQMFIDSTKFAVFLNNCRIVSMVNKHIKTLLAKGKLSSETIHSQKLLLPGKLEPIWVEKTKKVTESDFNLGDLVQLKRMISIEPKDPLDTEYDPISQMSDEELMDIINKSSVTNAN